MAVTPNVGLELFEPLGVGWREDATAGALLDFNMMLLDSTIESLIVGGGSSVYVNAAKITSPNFNDSAPAAPGGYGNVVWQVTGSSVSAYVPLQVNADWNASSGLAQILNKPTIPAAQVQTDWNAVSGIGVLLNKPTLATVATSGSYSDLSSKPTLAATTAAVSHQWLTSYNATTGAFGQTQPAAADLSDSASSAGYVLRANGTSFVSAQLGVADLAFGALANFTTATTQPNASDASTKVATDAFVQNAIELSMGTLPLNLGGLGPATYSFASLGSGALVNYMASGGVITSITVWVPFVGSGYKAGDLITVSGGNYDAIIAVTAVAGGGYPTLGVILYGGTGYTSGTSIAAPAVSSIPFTFLLSGALSGNIEFLMSYGTYQTQSNQWIFCNNTTGAYTVTVGVSNSTNTGASGGRTVVIPQGSNNNRSVFIQDDGELNTDLAGVVNYADLGGLPTLAGFTVAALPSTSATGMVEGAVAYATNGLKVGETTGNGTGVPVYYSNGHWRVYSTDLTVAA